MQCLMTDIENYFTYKAARARILDNGTDAVKCLEVMTIKMKNKRKYRDISERDVPCFSNVVLQSVNVSNVPTESKKYYRP